MDEIAALIEVYEGLERGLREGGSEAVGWRGHLAALRAVQAGSVAGDWEELVRFLEDPPVRDEAAGEVVRDALAGGDQVLVLVPDRAAADEVFRAAGTEVFALLVEGDVAAAPVAAGPVAAAPPVVREEQDYGSNGTVEFRPLTSAEVTRAQEIPSEPSSAEVTRAQEVPSEPSSAEVTRAQVVPPEPEAPVQEGPVHEAPEARTRGVVVRPVGEAWRQAWVTEGRMLQRGLMWLEQWPRDLAALEALEQARQRRREELDAELAGLASRGEELTGAVGTAEEAGARATEEATRLAAVQEEISAKLAGPWAEAQRLQAVADGTAEDAERLTGVAEATRARCAALDQRDQQARAELQSAQQQEGALTNDLARAREDLPRAAEEADRLVAESAAADADGHAKYYRLTAAESALAGRRRKMSLGQRLHVAAPPPELKDLRAEVKSLTREADGAAEKAQLAKEAAERAHGYRTQLEAFINEGGARLNGAQEAQRQLGAELVRLATERQAAAADYQEKAAQASEAVERARQASAVAVEANRVAQEIDGRLVAARHAYEGARIAHERARAEAEAAKAGAAEAEALLVRRRAEAEQELSARSAEYEAATEAEARSRENVQEICGSEPIDKDLLATHQQRAMVRIEQLTKYLERDEAGEEAREVMLRTAELVCGTPAAVGAAPEAEFDVLVVAGAGAVNRGDFLVGAVRARRWILVAGPDERPPAYGEYAGERRLLEPLVGRP
ncbi:hypothetical protein [Actinomadura sp. 9N407]|uniref:hypothetical protein n=1 Tax=Actinomadura sp. 9N407 TaxID=3375154 RepID=UPI00378C9FE5